MTKRALVISMLATAAALALFMSPLAGIDAVEELLVSDEVNEAAAQTCDKDAKQAPLDYTIKDMNGVDVKLASFKGRVILLNFWATWCGPCKAEIPGFVELQQKYANDRVILGLSVDDPVDKLKPYAAQYKIN